MGSAGTQVINSNPFPGAMANETIRYVDRLCLDRTYELTTIPSSDSSMNPTSAHPYHQHTNHLQITNLNNVDATAAADVILVGEWRDTIPAIPPNGVTFRFRTYNWTGEMVLHCHMVQHSDRGMMGLFNISTACQEPNTATSVTRNGLRSFGIMIGIIAVMINLAQWLRFVIT